MRRGWMVNVGGLLLAFGAFVAAGCGDDDGVSCPTGQTACGNTCVNLQDNEANCGRCGAACAAGEQCNMGMCGVEECPAGQERCDGVCVNTSRDPENCGACGTACAGTEVCNNGMCETSCGDLDVCDGACVDLQTDETNCGACGAACDGTQNCVAGECACRTGETDCDGTCTNVDNDPANCGTCGNACADGEACVRGECSAGGCMGDGLMMCGDECVDTLNNPANCGACGNACPSGQVCAGGACECPDPLLDCDGVCANTQSDNENCGACGTACAAGEVCLAGECGDRCDPLTTCPTGCADLQSDPNNCGSCGTVVPVGFICQGGMQVCPPGTQDCGGTCVALNDPNNCGACGTVCAAPTPACLFDIGTGTASCQSDCPSGQTRCGASCVNTSADNGNCGGCGLSCGGGSSCMMGACSCGSLTDCDPTDTGLACADLTSSRDHCGACGNACATGEACVTSGATTSCQVATPTGLRVDCPMTTFPAGAGAVQCRAFLTFGGGIPDQDVTTAPETTWPSITVANCTGSAVCGTPNGPQLVTTGANRGRFTPAGSIDAAAVASPTIATPNVTWTRGTLMLSDSIVLTTEPAMAIGYRVDPENITLPYLFDVICGGGMVTRFRLLRTFAGGGTSVVPASSWTVSSASGSVLSVASLCDGSGTVAQTTAPGGLSAPREHTLTARVGAMDVATTTVTITNEGRDRLRIVPTAQTTGRGVPTSQFRSFIDFGPLEFEITRLGDLNNVGAVGCGLAQSNPAIPYNHYWNCDSGSSTEDTLFPWLSGGASNIVQHNANLWNTAGVAVPINAYRLFISDYGVFTPDTTLALTPGPSSPAAPGGPGTDGTWTLTQYFPFESFGTPSETNFTITVTGRQGLACRFNNNPSTLSVNASTAAPGNGFPGAASQVQVAFSTGATENTCNAAGCAVRTPGLACTADIGDMGGCNPTGTPAGSAPFVCVAGTCRAIEDSHPADPGFTVAQTSAISWTSSAPAFVTVANADGTRGQLTGVAPGSSNVSATYTDSFGTVACTTYSTTATPGTTSFVVNVVPSMLCDIIVTTRPFLATANPGDLDTGAADRNRTGRSRGIDDGFVPTAIPSANEAGDAGLARRRAYYTQPSTPGTPGAGHDLSANPIGGLDPDSQLGNDPRVLLPNVTGLTQQFTAVGYFANNGLSANCGSTPGNMFPQDITARVSWDVVGTSGNIDMPLINGTALTTDAALTVDANGLATVVNSTTMPSRIQAVRATVNSGERFCTGNGTAVGARATTNPCVHALGFEVCGAPATTANSVVTTPWTGPIASPPPAVGGRTPFRAGVTNPTREAFSPVNSPSNADVYETFVGDTAIRYYSLQTFTGACALLPPGATGYQMDFSERATWSSTNGGIASVSGGALTAISAGTTTISSSQTFGATTLSDTLDFRVASGVINSISSSPTAAIAEVIALTEGTPLPGGATLRNEVWLQPTFTVTGGTTPTATLGGSAPNIEWILLSGAANCVQQYDGAGTADSDWRDFGTVGMGSTAGIAGAARFRANPSITAAGCTATLRPQCRDVAGGQQCSPTMVTYTDTTLTVRRGSISASNFFIQSPDRTCNDAPASNWTFGRYRTTDAGLSNGMGADFYVCLRPSFGAWLRYDLGDDGATDHPDIDWGMPLNPIVGGQAAFIEGAGPGSGNDRGYVRYNSAHTVPATGQLVAAHTAAGLSDSLDMFSVVDVATALTVTSPNSGASASATCTALATSAPASGTMDGCLLSNQSELFRVSASVAGVAAPIDVTSDHLVTMSAMFEGTCPGALTFSSGPNDFYRGQIATVGTVPMSFRGYCNSRLTANVALAAENVDDAIVDIALLSQNIVSYTTNPAGLALTLTGAGSVGAITTQAGASVGGSTVTVNTSWSQIGMTPVLGVASCSGTVPVTGTLTDCGLNSTNPSAANPWTSRYWTPAFAPAGILTVSSVVTPGAPADDVDVTVPGTPEYSFVYAGAVPAAQTSSIVARIPNGPPALTITATVNP
ncbi:MAG: hypothetical protein IT379_42545 [Deltaproteobacteria bacterium]|nr:hypothetical protein [Deltaproteobacteria bacterium]